ncbi:MAG: nucleotidyltransferase family protein [Candidatus Competibacter sp.]|nr:nucleotidyltransferase family protein [Candidatus Competibacter sp.]
MTATPATCPEQSLLLWCTSCRPPETRQEAIHRLLARSPDFDWERLLRLAAINRVSSLLYRNLSRLEPSPAPAPILARLRQQYWNHSLWSLQLKAELLRIVRAFAAADIPVLPLKGPVLAALYYPDPTRRESADLDILVRREYLPQAKNRLAGLGYALVEERLGHDFHITFQHTANKTHVELHWQATSSLYRHYDDGVSLWQNAKIVLWENTPVLVPTTENLLIFLCVHAFRHDWNRLQWISDIPHLLEAHPEMDWPFVVAQAKRLRVYRILIVILRLADDLYELDLPGQFRESLSARWLSEREIQRISNNLFLEIKSYPFLREIFFFDSSSDSLGFVLNYFLKCYQLTPNEKDFQWLSLPRRLHFLYYLTRPVRLMKQYGASVGIRVLQRLHRSWT